MAEKPRSSNHLLAAIAKATEITGLESHRQRTPGEEGVGLEISDARKKNGRPRRRGDRTGTRLIAGHFDPGVARQLRMLAAEEDTTIQSLLGEALNLLFVKKGKGKIISAEKSDP